MLPPWKLTAVPHSVATARTNTDAPGVTRKQLFTVCAKLLFICYTDLKTNLRLLAVPLYVYNPNKISLFCLLKPQKDPVTESEKLSYKVLYNSIYALINFW